MERLQDQTRSEESGQGVIIIQSRDLMTRDRTVLQVPVREGAERNSTFADTWTLEWRVMKNISDTGTTPTHG